jgi:hypothetical protein
VGFDVDTLVAASAMVVVGFQAMLFPALRPGVRRLGGLPPEEAYAQRVLAKLALERGIVLGTVIGRPKLSDMVCPILVISSAVRRFSV